MDNIGKSARGWARNGGEQRKIYSLIISNLTKEKTLNII